MAESKGKLHDVFLDRTKELAANGEANAGAIRGTSLRVWDMPAKGPGDPLDIAGTTEAFDRGEIDANFEEVVGDGKNPGTIGDVVSIKLQGDYIAIQERAYRARHCTPIRCMAMAHARRKGHGHAKGVLLTGAIGYAQDALKAGQE